MHCWNFNNEIKNMWLPSTEWLNYQQPKKKEALEFGDGYYNTSYSFKMHIVPVIVIYKSISAQYAILK